MADNFTYTPGVGETGGADDIAGVKFPRVKLIHGADGTNDGDVSSVNPLPVTDAAGEALLTTIDGDTSSIAVDVNSIDGKITACDTGAVTISASVLPTGASTSARQDAQTALLTTIDGDTSSIAVDVNSIASDTTSIDGKITACNTGAVVLAAGTAEIGKLAAGIALIGKVSIDQATANANEVVVKSGTVTTVTSVTNDVGIKDNGNSITVDNAGTFAVQATQSLSTGYGQGKVDNADTTTARAITGAEAQAGKKFYITSIILSVAVAGSYWIEDADAAQITCKFTLAANGGVSAQFPINTPFVSTTANKGLYVKGSIAGVVGCQITFYAA